MPKRRSRRKFEDAWSYRVATVDPPYCFRSFFLPSPGFNKHLIILHFSGPGPGPEFLICFKCRQIQLEPLGNTIGWSKDGIFYSS